MTTGATAALDSIGSLDQHHQSGSNKTAAAAKDFEALLMGQILKSARSSSGWLGTDDDDAGEAAIGLGEEQLARTMAQSGGFGLSKLIESGIRSDQDTAEQPLPAQTPQSRDPKGAVAQAITATHPAISSSE